MATAQLMLVVDATIANIALPSIQRDLGVGAALIAPNVLALIANNFAPGKARNNALAVYAAVSAVGMTVGILLGGLLTGWLDWRWVLFINTG